MQEEETYHYTLIIQLFMFLYFKLHDNELAIKKSTYYKYMSALLYYYIFKMNNNNLNICHTLMQCQNQVG